jgi:hypothetical protein
VTSKYVEKAKPANKPSPMQKAKARQTQKLINGRRIRQKTIPMLTTITPRGGPNWLQNPPESLVKRSTILRKPREQTMAMYVHHFQSIFICSADILQVTIQRDWFCGFLPAWHRGF